MEGYRYRPLRFYLAAFGLTWLFWLPALFLPAGPLSLLAMLLGLLAPATVALVMVLSSKSRELKQDLKRKLVGFYKLKPGNLLLAAALFLLVIAGSILLSAAFGQSLSQFAFTEDFSFRGVGSALLTILLASVIEEIGWRGYGEDAIAQYCTWFKESLIFGLVWALWHLPLFWLPDTYHYGLRLLGPVYMLNFFVSGMPLGFFTTWVYVNNGRSMLACIIFHLFVNFMQERIAMTPQTKCLETMVITLAAAFVVLANKELFFERRHIGRLPREA